MRWLLVFLILLGAAWYLNGWERPRPPTAEESFIGGSVKTLRKAEGFEKSYLEATDERKKRMEEQLEKDSGG
jgi:hypothetical protein